MAGKAQKGTRSGDRKNEDEGVPRYQVALHCFEVGAFNSCLDVRVTLPGDRCKKGAFSKDFKP